VAARRPGAAIAPTPLRALGRLVIYARNIEEEKQPCAISTLVRGNVEHPRYDLCRNDVERRLVLSVGPEKVSLAINEGFPS
jgi:hypothetical protein